MKDKISSNKSSSAANNNNNDDLSITTNTALTVTTTSTTNVAAITTASSSSFTYTNDTIPVNTIVTSNEIFYRRLVYGILILHIIITLCFIYYASMIKQRIYSWNELINTLNDNEYKYQGCLLLLSSSSSKNNSMSILSSCQ